MLNSYMSRVNLIRSIVDQIKQSSTQEQKLQILQKYNKESLFKRILFFAYNPMIQFDMDDFESTTKGRDGGMGISKFLHILDDIIKNQLTKQESIFACKIAMSHINDIEADIFLGILKKDLNLDLELSTINEAYDDMIPGYPLQHVSEFDPMRSKFTFPAVAQRMSHGMRINIVVKGNVVQFRNKQGEIFHEFDRFADQFKTLAQSGSMVFDGHAVKIDSNNKPILNLTDEEIQNTDVDYVRFILWDSIRFDGFVEGKDTRIGYNWRFNGLEHMMFLAADKNTDPVYGLPDQAIVNSVGEAIQISHKYPIILKDFSGTWRTGITQSEVLIKKS